MTKVINLKTGIFDRLNEKEKGKKSKSNLLNHFSNTNFKSVLFDCLVGVD